MTFCFSKAEISSAENPRRSSRTSRLFAPREGAGVQIDFRYFREFHRGPNEFFLSPHRIRNIHDHLPGSELRTVHQVTGILGGADRDPVLQKNLDDLFVCPLSHPFIQNGLKKIVIMLSPEGTRR